IVTELLAQLNGMIVIKNNCVHVNSSDLAGQSYLLLWPPDLTASIVSDTVRITTGIVSGQRRGGVFHNGEKIHMNGGEVYPNDQLRSTEPAYCPGPYWVVGSSLQGE